MIKQNIAKDKEIAGLTDLVKSLSKMMLSLDQAFRVETDKDYIAKPNEVITYSEEELKEFREKVKELNK